MTLNIKPYDLPDAAMFNGYDNGIRLWQPDKTYIILGQSNTPEGSVRIKNVLDDNITVMKRPTGGEAVILTPGMLVITITKETDKFMPSSLFFRETNERIKYTLSLNGVKSLNSKGISDICIGEKKILGSAMHRKANRMVYHAVLNIEEESSIIEKYLLHPKREPEYRSGRSHSMFVTSLQDEGFKINNYQLIAILKTLFINIGTFNSQNIQKSTLITA